MSIKIEQTIEMLINEGHVPYTGSFDITSELLDIYSECYRDLHAKTDYKSVKPSDIKYARKLAGMNLHKLRLKRVNDTKKKETRNTLKEGFVYIVSNPAFPTYVKIGMTTDIQKRLSTYQTGDPNRAYKLERFEFVYDMREVERKVFEEYKMSREGEWLSIEDAYIAFDKVLKGV